MKRAAALAAALAVVSLIGVAKGGAPTVWERIARPDRERAERVHRVVEQLLVEAQGLRFHTAEADDRLSTALRMLQGFDAAHAPDVRLRFDLGRVLSLLEQNARGAAALEAAIAEAPDDPMVSDAYFALAVCYAHLGRPADEIAAYDAVLRRETDPGARSEALSNRAEAHMLREDTRAAIDDYRESLALEPGSVLARWGLAVALDRTGDLTGAFAEARQALLLDPVDRELGRTDVFFIPPYDRYWYEGLGAMVRAQNIADKPTAALWWETAVVKWSEYLAAAPSDGRWVPIAKLHHEACAKALTTAASRSQAIRNRGAGGKLSPHGDH